MITSLGIQNQIIQSGLRGNVGSQFHFGPLALSEQMKAIFLKSDGTEKQVGDLDEIGLLGVA